MPRKTYTVDFPDGHTQTFDGPDGMGRADVISRAKQERGFAGGEIATSFAGGATRHLLEDEPQTVNALLGGAATASGAGAPLVAAIPAATRGLKHLSQLIATGQTDVPTGTELAQDAVEGAVGGYGGAALGATARGVGRAKAAIQETAQGLPAWMRALTGLSAKGLLIDAATSKPVLGAVEQIGEGLTPGGIRSAFGRVAEGMTPGVAAEARPSAGYAMSRSTSPSMRKLQEATKARPPVSAATGTSADVAAPTQGGWPAHQWLDDLSRQADEMRPARPAAAARTSSGMTAEPTAADYPEWLSNAGREADAAIPPSGELHATGWPGGPTPQAGPSYGNWMDRAVGDARAARPVAPAPALPTPPPPAPPPVEYPSWLRSRTGSGTSVGAGPFAAPTESAVVSAADDLVPAAESAIEDVVAPVARPAQAAPAAPRPHRRTKSQFEEFTPEARAARAAARRAAAGEPAVLEEGAAADDPLFAASLRSLQRQGRLP